MDPGAVSWLVWFVWAGVKAVNRTLVRTKLLDQDRMKRWVLVHLQEDSAGVDQLQDLW